jgi:hypothetical protein
MSIDVGGLQAGSEGNVGDELARTIAAVGPTSPETVRRVSQGTR